MNVVIYLRQSQDRTGEELGILRQRDDARKLAELRGWTVIAELVDNDLSASGKRTRPGFEAVLTAIETGQAGAVIAWDMSRLSRNRRDTLRLLDLGERHNTHLAFCRGSDMDLSTPAGRLSADILAGVARHEIDQKSDRQKRAIAQAAAAGRRVGGRRPFGYQADGIAIHPVEAAALKGAYQAVLAGVSMGRAARDLNKAGHHTPQPTRAGKPSPWTAQSLGLAMRNPRYAGLRAVKQRPEHGRGRWDIIGPAVWPAIVDEETWRAVDALLGSPQRRRPSRDGIGLLTGIGECGVCADGTTVHRGASPRGGAKTYRCRGSMGHFSRRAEPIDDYVGEVIVARLNQPDAREVLMQGTRPDVAALRAELNALTARLAELAELHADGTVTAAQLRAGTQRARARIHALEDELMDAGRANVLGPILNGGDVAATWKGMDVDRRRAIIATLVRVVVYPAGQGRRDFNPATVHIEWRE
jgi:site-specific DNA recombinase